MASPLISSHIILYTAGQREEVSRDTAGNLQASDLEVLLNSHTRIRRLRHDDTQTTTSRQRRP